MESKRTGVLGRIVKKTLRLNLGIDSRDALEAMVTSVVCAQVEVREVGGADFDGMSEASNADPLTAYQLAKES